MEGPSSPRDRYSPPRCLTVSAALAIGLLTGVFAGQEANGEPTPTSELQDSGRFEAQGLALRSVLERLARVTSARLGASRALENQRVTLLLSKPDSTKVQSALTELLSVDRNAAVVWNSSGSGAKRLEETLKLRNLKEELRDLDLRIYADHLDRELTWLKSSADRELAAAAEAGGAQALKGRFAVASLLQSIGVQRRTELLQGKPLYVRVGDLPAAIKPVFRDYLLSSRPDLKSDHEAALEGHGFVYLLARTPDDVNGAFLIESTLEPKGGATFRHSLLHVAGARRSPLLLSPLRLKPTDPTDRSRRVTVNLAPEPGVQLGTIVRRNLDQLLLTISREAGLDVVADGYIRSDRAIPANLQVSDYPIKQLLDSISRAWGCDVRFVGSGETMALVRAKAWWLEDAADVPEPLFGELIKRLAPGRKPELEDLLLFAELSKAQAHKLYEGRTCPGAQGVVQGLWYDDSGPKPVLQFFSRLPGGLKQRAQSAAGLLLRDAPADLVRMWLSTTLIANVGVASPELQGAVVFSLRPVGDAGSGGCWEVSFVRPSGTRWERRIGRPLSDKSAPPFNPLQSY